MNIFVYFKQISPAIGERFGTNYTIFTATVRRSFIIKKTAAHFVQQSLLSFDAIALYQLEEYDLSVVSLTRTKLKDSCVSALSVCVLWCDIFK